MNRRAVLRRAGALCLGAAATVAGGTGVVTAHDGGGDSGTVDGPTDETGYEPLGVVDLPGATDAVVGDGVVYVAIGDGYAVVDVADPREPHVVSRRATLQPDGVDEPLVNVQDLAVEGETLVVAGPAHPRRNAPAGLVVVDVADPARPRTRGFFPTDYPIHNCDLSDGRAYLTANEGDRNALVVVDVSDSAQPREVGSWSLLDVDDAWARVSPGRRTLHDVTVHDGLAACAHWDAGTWLLDVTDPADPTVTGTLEAPDPTTLSNGGPAPGVTPPGNHHYATLDEAGALLAVGKETFGVGVDDDGDGTDDRVVGGPSGVSLWDVSEPATPRKRSTIHPPQSDDATFAGTWTTAHNLDLADGTLYTAWYQGGVKRHDVSDPSDPVEVSWWLAPGTASFWTALAVTSGPGGFFVAPSRGVDDVPGRFYTFPNRPGHGGATSHDRVRPSGSSTSPTDDSPTDSAVSAPGFGPASATAALGGGLWWLWRRATTSDD